MVGFNLHKQQEPGTSSVCCPANWSPLRMASLLTCAMACPQPYSSTTISSFHVSRFPSMCPGFKVWKYDVTFCYAPQLVGWA